MRTPMKNFFLFLLIFAASPARGLAQSDASIGFCSARIESETVFDSTRSELIEVVQFINESTKSELILDSIAFSPGATIAPHHGYGSWNLPRRVSESSTAFFVLSLHDLEPGIYTDTVTFYFRCPMLSEAEEKASFVLRRWISASHVADIEASDELVLSPNPAAELINVRTRGGSYASVELLTVLGETIRSEKISSPAFSVDLTKVPNGVYYLRLAGDTSSSVRKLVIAR